MNRYVIALILIAIAISSYRVYTFYERKTALEKNRPKVTDFKKDLADIFRNNDMKKQEPGVETTKINTIIPPDNMKIKNGKFYTNEDIKKLDLKKSKNRKFITEKDFQKYKKDDNEKVSEKAKEIKEKRPDSKLEQLIDNTKKSISPDKDNNSD